MTNSEPQSDRDPASGLPTPVDPGTIDLGDDASRDATNWGSGLDQTTTDRDPASGLPVPIDPGTTDLGDDAHRSAG